MKFNTLNLERDTKGVSTDALGKWFLTRSNFLTPLPTTGTFGSILETVGVVAFGRGATGIYWVETRDLAKYPMMHRTKNQRISQHMMPAVPKLRNPVLGDTSDAVTNAYMV